MSNKYYLPWFLLGRNRFCLFSWKKGMACLPNILMGSHSIFCCPFFAVPHLPPEFSPFFASTSSRLLPLSASSRLWRCGEGNTGKSTLWDGGLFISPLCSEVIYIYVYIYTWEYIKSVRPNILKCVNVSLTTHCEVLPPQNPTWCQNGNRPASALDLLLVVTSIVLLYVTSWVRTFWLLTAISISLTYYESNIWLSPKLSTYAPWCT